MNQNKSALTQTTNRITNLEEKTKNPEKEESFWTKKKTIILVSIIITVIVAILIVVLSITLTKKKKIERKKTSKNNYIIGVYNSQKGIPLKIFNPSRIGLSEQNYTLEIFNINNTRRLQELNNIDGVIIPEITETIQIKIIFNEYLTSLDFMFEGCSDLIKVSLSNLNSLSVTSMIYTFTDCTNLETVDFTYFSSSKVEKMDFLFGGCKNLVNIKGFENLDTSSLQKTSGMFLECTNLISVNLSSFQLNNISEPNGMFIENPSLEKLDLGDTSNINGLFSSTENFKVTIITTSSEINSSGLNGDFTRISREENQQLNCTLRNWTEFKLRVSYFKNFLKSDELDEIINFLKNNYIEQEIYVEVSYFAEIDCNSNYSNEYFNISECELFKRFYKDILNELEKCSECDEEERRMYCKSCNNGYYVPKGIDFSPTKCKRCDEGCEDCVSENETDKSICIRCLEKYSFFEYYYEDYYKDEYEDSFKLYKLYNGKCFKRCRTGEGEKCQSCNEEEDKYDQCSTCNNGYYFDVNYNKRICRKIEIKNCTQAIIESDTVRCTNCSNGYILHNGQCEKACEIGYYEDTCASCNQSYEFRESCASCHSGFYLLPYENKIICSYCNIYYCKECEYISGEKKCTECYSDYFLVDGQCINSCSGGCSNCIYNNGKWLCNKCYDNYFLKEIGEGTICESCSEGCKTCIDENNCNECMEGYKLVDGRCNFYCNIGSYSSCKSCDFNEMNKCKDCNPGYYLPNNSLSTQSYCSYCGSNCLSCYGNNDNPICTQCYSGYYLSNNKCIRQCNLGYYYDYCKTCDESNLGNCGSCYDGYYLAINYKSYCSYCGSYKIKKCHQESNYAIIVDECYSDYILIRNSCVEKCDSKSYWSNCLICNEEYDKLDQCKQCKEGYYLPTNLDNNYCYYCPYNCKSCEGSDYEPTCTSCYDGYKLSGGKCLKDCTIGNNYLCKSCNSEPGKIDRCLECNEGYYLPDNNYYQNQCSKCPNNCQKCKGIDYYYVDCIQCSTGYYLALHEVNEYSYYYNPTYYHECLQCNIPGCSNYKPNSNICICIECTTPIDEQIKNGDIANEYISCYKDCEIGVSDKCKSCGSKKGECGECNEGYTLNSNGKCIGDFHMFAKYRTTSENEYVKFMSSTRIIKMTINGTFIDNPTYYYTFPLPGEHKIYVKFSNSVSFMDLFYRITHLTYIEFLPKAKDFYINYMNDCFCGCTNLEYADLSNLNLKSNRCFMNFFKDDKKLKEVKFPVESFSNIYWYYRMFYGCESLTSIDMSNIHNTNGEYFYEMFYGCTNLKSINLGGFNKAYNGYYNYDIFVNVPNDAEITIHNNFYTGISKQLNNFSKKKINY